MKPPAPRQAGKVQAAVSRAARAQVLLEHELLQEAFKKLEDDYVAARKTWPAADGDGRERPRQWSTRWGECATISPAWLPTASSRNAN